MHEIIDTIRNLDDNNVYIFGITVPADGLLHFDAGSSRVTSGFPAQIASKCGKYILCHDVMS